MGGKTMSLKKQVLNYLDAQDKRESFASIMDLEPDQVFVNGLSEIYSVEKNAQSVLGIDIYHYSKAVGLQQDLIPVLFDILFEETIDNAIEMVPFLFQKIKADEMIEDLIQTGDGGFIVFETPLHAIIFATLFEANVRLYNGGRFYPKLRTIVKEITLRYAITCGQLFKYHGNHYGPAIINNARLLSKDKLNRLLIDSDVYSWFLVNMNGIESLEIITIEALQEMPQFSSYEYDEEKKNILVVGEGKENEFNRIRSINVSKIGDTSAKNTPLDIYNAQIKAVALFEEDNCQEGSERQVHFVYTIGNLNSTGIIE
jgi:hypothetical protein